MGGQYLQRAGSVDLSLSFDERAAKAARIGKLFDNMLSPRGVYIETNPRFMLSFYDVIIEELLVRRPNMLLDIVELRRFVPAQLCSMVRMGYFTFNADTDSMILR